MSTRVMNVPDDSAELAEWHAGHPPRNGDAAAMDPHEIQAGWTGQVAINATQLGKRLSELRRPEPDDRPESIPQVQTHVTAGTIDFPRVNKRAELLERAESIVNGARNVQYGDPKADFRRTAALWSAYLGVEIQPFQVAILMALLKISRLAWSPDHADNWLDLAGYAACGYDCSDAALEAGQVGR